MALSRIPPSNGQWQRLSAKVAGSLCSASRNAFNLKGSASLKGLQLLETRATGSGGSITSWFCTEFSGLPAICAENRPTAGRQCTPKPQKWLQDPVPGNAQRGLGVVWFLLSCSAANKLTSIYLRADSVICNYL